VYIEQYYFCVTGIMLKHRHVGLASRFDVNFLLHDETLMALNIFIRHTPFICVIY